MNLHALAFASLCLAAAAQALSAADFAERKVTPVDGYQIEADPADREYIDALAARLRQTESAGTRDPLRLSVEKLRTERGAVLDEVAKALALPRPTPLMGEAFDRFSHAYATIHDAMIRGRPSRFALWRKADLMARLRAGQQIPGFALDGDDVVASLNANFDAPPDTPAAELATRITRAWQQLVWPVPIGNGTPAADIDASLANLTDFRQAAAGAEQAAVMTVLHETVESTLVSEFLRSPDRRWFCEGVANYVALQVIRKRVGEERAREYYPVDQLLARVGEGSFAELEKWPAAETAAARHYASEINEANYVRATAVIQRLAAKHGESLLPRWLAEIRKTPAAKANIQTVYAAYTQVTGEEFPRT